MANNPLDRRSEPIRRDFSEFGEEVTELGRHVERVRAEQNLKGDLEKKEMVRQSVQRMAKELPPETESQTHVVAPAPLLSDEESYLPEYIKTEELSDEIRAAVEGLLRLVLDKGIIQALKASKRHSPFIQDTFHDALADKLLPELERRGVI